MAPSSAWRCEPLLLLLLLLLALLAPAASSVARCLEESSCPRGFSVDDDERSVPYLWEELPPQELVPPPLKDVPALVNATPSELSFTLLVTKKNGRCPQVVVWTWKAYKTPQNIASESERTHNCNILKSGCEFNIVLTNLTFETVYKLQGQPQRAQGNKWYDKEDTPMATYSYPAFARTCSREVPSIKDLLIHSVGRKWFGVSWIPPEVDCVTKLEYRVRYLSEDAMTDMYQEMGSFWSYNIHNVDDRVSPCLAWPERHCLLLTADLDRVGEVRVAIMVKRMSDRKDSDKVEKKLSLSTFNSVPEPPLGLHAVARATELELRWRCPLVLGGRLHSFTVEALWAGGRSIATQLVTLCPAYGHTLQHLNPNTEYTVSVWFVSTAGPGQPASITVRTLAQPTTSTTSSSSTSTSSSTETSTTEASECITTPLPHQQLLVKREDENQWIWTAGCSALLLLVFVAFFVGRRCGERRRWESSGLEKAQSCYGINSKGGAGAGGGGGDKASLCAAAAAGASTPPASVLDYAEVEVEVDLSSQRAWAAVARPGDHYEELPAAPDKPYANIGDQREATNHYYAEVHKPPPPPPPAVKPKPKPTPTPAPTGSAPVYAEVDLQKKHAQRAKH